MGAVKLHPTDEKLAELLRSAGVRPEAVEEIGGGTFNTAYRVTTRDRRLVLKIAPQESGLSHEHDLLSTEASFYRAATDALPVPEVVHVDTTERLVPSDWLLMTECPGVNWYENAESVMAHHTDLRKQLGAAVTRLHQVTGQRAHRPGHPAHHRNHRRRTFVLG
jgi:aminoglycoside phosphotransferase (APT) family kinase protein